MRCLFRQGGIESFHDDVYFVLVMRIKCMEKKKPVKMKSIPFNYKAVNSPCQNFRPAIHC